MNVYVVSLHWDKSYLRIATYRVRACSKTEAIQKAVECDNQRADNFQ